MESWIEKLEELTLSNQQSQPNKGELETIKEMLEDIQQQTQYDRLDEQALSSRLSEEEQA